MATKIFVNLPVSNGKPAGIPPISVPVGEKLRGCVKRDRLPHFLFSD